MMSKEEFAKHASEPSISLAAYLMCPVCCSSSYDICVSTIKQCECRRYEDYEALFSQKSDTNSELTGEEKRE